MTLEDKKNNFSKIFKYDENNKFYLRTLLANSDKELNQIIIDNITKTLNPIMSFEEKKYIHLKYIEKIACDSQYLRIKEAINEEELCLVAAQNYVWWRIHKCV